MKRDDHQHVWAPVPMRPMMYFCTRCRLRGRRAPDGHIAASACAYYREPGDRVYVPSTTVKGHHREGRNGPGGWSPGSGKEAP